MKRLLILFAALTVSFLVFFSTAAASDGTGSGLYDPIPAGGNQESEGSTPDARGGEPGEPGEGNEKSGKSDEEGSEPEVKELVFALSAGDVNFDPLHAYTALESQVYTAIYEGLVTYNPLTLQPMPGVANRWEKSPDGKTYRFYLRDDALYSNGDQVRAQDFRDNWMRMLDPEADAEYSTFFDIIEGARDYRTGREEDPETVGIRVISESVLDVELETPAAHFLKLLCHMSFVIVHPHYLESEEGSEDSLEARTSIVGNGPFYVIERSEEKVVLVKNNLYWDRRRVELDRIVLRFYDNPGEMSLGFNRGDIHWANNWDSGTLEDRSAIVFNPLFATNFFFFKCVDEPWNDHRVRRAMALLVPWSRIRTDQIFYATDTLVPQVPDYPEVEGIAEQDRREAMSLLEEAGYPRGEGLPPIVIRVTAGGDASGVVGIMAEAWRESLETEVEIDQVSFRQYFASVKRDDFTLGRMTWIGDFADPLTFLQMWTSESNLNDAKYSDTRYDGMVEKAIPVEGDERYRMLAEAEGYLLEQAVVLPISNQPSVNLIDLDYIEGWYPNALDIHPFKYLSFKEARPIPNLVLR